MATTNFKAELELLKDIMDTMVTVYSKEDTPEDTKVMLFANSLLISNVFDFIKKSLPDGPLEWREEISPLLEPEIVGVDSNEIHLDE